jgi:hypothetical protein
VVDGAATALADGSLIVLGGRAPPPAGGPLAPTGVVTRLAPAAGATLELRTLAAALAVPRAGHTATRLSDDLGAPVLVAGGVDAEGSPVALAELFKPLREAFADPSEYAPALAVPRHGHAAVRTPDGGVLIVGGLDAAGAPVRALELFSVDGGFTPAGDLPAAAGSIEVALTTLPDGRILISGGRAEPGGPALASAFIARLDPLDGSVDVVATDQMGRPRAGHQAALLCDGTVLVVGGAGADAPAERYNPPPVGRR